MSKFYIPMGVRGIPNNIKVCPGCFDIYETLQGTKRKGDMCHECGMKVVIVNCSMRSEADVVDEMISMRNAARAGYIPVVKVEKKIDHSIVNGMFEDDFD